MNQIYRRFFWFSFLVFTIVTTTQNYLDQPQNFSFLLKFAYSAPLIRLHNGRENYVVETCPMSKQEVVEFLTERKNFCSNQGREEKEYLVLQMKDSWHGHAGTLKIYLSCLPFPIVLRVPHLRHNTNYVAVIPYPYTNQQDCKVQLRWKNFWGGS